MKKSILNISTILLLLSMLSSCGLEKEIDLDLPAYDNKLVLECYLEPGQPMALLLTRASDYFSPFPKDLNGFVEGILEQGATVEIRHKGQTFQLKNQLTFNPVTQRVFNYSAQNLVPEDYQSPFELYITTADGKTIAATTQLLPVVPIDSVVVQYQENDTLARVLTYFTDDRNQTNYYRRVLHHSSFRDSIPDQDFVVDDRLADNGVFVFGTGYDFAPGDTVFTSLFHINRVYYNFLESLTNAVSSNGNPFGQPSPIISDLQGTAGAIGIFTGLSYDRQRVIIKDP